MTTVLKIDGMMCGHCVARVTGALKALEGVTDVNVSLQEKQATVEHADCVAFDTMKNSVEDLGFTVVC